MKKAIDRRASHCLPRNTNSNTNNNTNAPMLSHEFGISDNWIPLPLLRDKNENNHITARPLVTPQKHRRLELPSSLGKQQGLISGRFAYNATCTVCSKQFQAVVPKGLSCVRCPRCSCSMSVEVHNTSPQETSEPAHARIHSDTLYPINTPLKSRVSALQTSVTPSSVPPRPPPESLSQSVFHFESAQGEIHKSDVKKEGVPEVVAQEFTLSNALQQRGSGITSSQSRGQYGGFVSRRGGRTGSPLRPKNEDEPLLPILCPQSESSSSPKKATQPLQANVDTPSLISFASDGSPLKKSRNSKPEEKFEEVASSNIFSQPQQTEDELECKERSRSPPPMVCFADEPGGGGHHRYLSGVPLGDLKFTSPCAFSPFLNVTESPMPSTKLTPIAGKSCLKSPKAKDFQRTPTNYGLLNGSFDTPNAAKCLDTPSAFSWLQSPNPGLLSSTDLCGDTPVSHFFKEVGGLDDPPKGASCTAQHFSQICISPLASSRRSNLYHAGHTLALLRSPKSPKMAMPSSSFNAQMDRMMPMEDDDDLNVLLELATFKTQGDVFRSPVVQQDYQKLAASDAQKPSLQLPVMNSCDSSRAKTLRSPNPKNTATYQYSGGKGPNPTPGKLTPGRGPPSKSPLPTKNAKQTNNHYPMPQRQQDGQYSRIINPTMMSRGGSISTVIGNQNSMPPRTFSQFRHPGQPNSSQNGHPNSNQNPNLSHLFPVTNTVPMFPTTSPKPPKKRPFPKEKKSPGSPKKRKMSSPPVDAKAKAAAENLAATKAGTSTESAAALAAAIMRGVTMRPSGKWQAQLYYAGKSRYIGVFDSREKAALAYEIAREQLKADPKEAVNQDSETTEAKVNQARKAAFEGVNEPDPKQAKKK